ncbi:MAG: hypothetical protein P4L41_09105 [Flavipsychrobacter sp.]|nr:hypothetical protein [Flavipsychrobacter sp.]
MISKRVLLLLWFQFSSLLTTLPAHARIVVGQDTQLFLYNAGFGCFSAGIGSIISKQPHTSFKKRLLKSCMAGLLGGSLEYAGKKANYLINANNNLAYALPARLVNNAGYSMVENGALGRPIFSHWCFYYNFIRFDYSVPENSFKARLLPWTIYGYAFCKQISSATFDLNGTLLTGDLAFKSHGFFYIGGEVYAGENYGHAFVYTDDYNKYHYIAHELTHEFQFHDLQVCNTFFEPLWHNRTKTRIYKLLDKYVYADFSYFLLAYNINSQLNYGQSYYSNFFEFEAERFASNAYVPR